MNTNTISFVLNKDTASAFRSAWSLYAQEASASAGEHLLQALLLGKDPLRAFTPISNSVKLANGQAKYGGFNVAARAIQSDEVYLMLARISPLQAIPQEAIAAARAAADELARNIKKDEAI